MQVLSQKKRKPFFKGKRDDLIFHWILLIWPLLQFSIFYIGVNLNSFRLAFVGMEGEFTFGWFENIFTLDNYRLSVFNGFFKSLRYWGISTAISLPLSLFFSHYIYKKYLLSGFFKVVLFLPSILSSMVMVLLFNKFMNGALLAIMHDINPETEEINILFNSNTEYDAYIIFFNIWIGFGTGVLIYSNSMATISPEVVEAAQLDGVNALQEFFHVALPHIYSTASVFLVTGIATLFVNQYNLFSFFGANLTDGGSIGYYIYVHVSSVAGDIDDPGNVTIYHQFSALGLLLTAFAIPLTFFVRWLLEKLGPSED